MSSRHRLSAPQHQEVIEPHTGAGPAGRRLQTRSLPYNGLEEVRQGDNLYTIDADGGIEASLQRIVGVRRETQEAMRGNLIEPGTQDVVE